MPEKFKDKYRIESIRLQNWNYAWSAFYFITICTANRKKYFGEIDNGQMILSDIGKEAEREWILTPDLRPDMNISLDPFCIMPNHFHGIIIIGVNEYNCRDAHVYCRDTMHRVSTDGKQDKFDVQRKNLASVVRGFKSSVTAYARKKDINFAWQTRFYDHIIRNNESCDKIRQYIVNNAICWEMDQFYLI